MGLSKETPDEFRARMERKAERARYFAGLELKARQAQVEASKPVVPKRPRAAATPKEPRPPRELKPRAPRAPKVERLAPCVDCGREMRRRTDKDPAHAHLAEFVSHGRCTTCNEAARRRRAGAKPVFVAPPNCVNCQRPMRRHGQPKVEGTVRHGGRGLCTRCYSEQLRREAGRGPHKRRPDNCTACGLPMRRGGVETGPPGSRRHAGGGLCVTCKKHTEGVKPMPPRPENCLFCGVKMRPATQIVGDGVTRRYAGKGKCINCADKARRKARREQSQ